MNEQEPLNMVLRNENREILSNMEIKGMKILEKNSFFTDLSDIMSDDKVKNFFDKYFKNMDDIKCTVVYMKLFRLFQKRYKDVSDGELSKYINVYLLHEAMNDKNIRETLIHATMDHLNDNSLPILNLTPEVLEKEKKRLKLQKTMDKYIKKHEKLLKNGEKLKDEKSS